MMMMMMMMMQLVITVYKPGYVVFWNYKKKQKEEIDLHEADKDLVKVDQEITEFVQKQSEEKQGSQYNQESDGDDDEDEDDNVNILGHNIMEPIQETSAAGNTSDGEGHGLDDAKSTAPDGAPDDTKQVRFV
uniref:Uncharacterized protein n=1 Tax=Lotharella globosa TaxID=91324 RepID=A0A7S4DM32_9EUKA